jgi:hypothetical protein
VAHGRPPEIQARPSPGFIRLRRWRKDIRPKEYLTDVLNDLKECDELYDLKADPYEMKNLI